jgi:hypothetical protein
MVKVIDKQGIIKEIGETVSAKQVAKHCVYLNIVCGLRDHATDVLSENFPDLTQEEIEAIEDEIDLVIDRLVKYLK